MQDAGQRPISILVAALGGQGGGVLAEWLVDAASRAGFPAQSTSIPGVAQRTGATTYYIEIFPVGRAALDGREPVLSLLPVPGRIDLIVASELLEAARIVQAGMADAERSTVVASTSRTLTTAEKMSLGDGRYASDRLLDGVRTASRRLVAFDMDEAARETGTVVSAVMFGAIAASGVLPFGRDACEAAIDAMGVGAESSRRGFARGFERTASPASAAAAANGPPANVAPSDPCDLSAFPPACRDIVAAGYRRVEQFQDARYGKLYLDRLAEIAAAERAADPREGHGAALTRESARFLALWMAFDDVVNVARQKSSASRFARVRREVAAADGDVLRIVDYFKPGVPEIAGVLPHTLARLLLAWDRRRQSRGRPPFALPLSIRSDGAIGFTVLRALAALRRFRPRSSRYADEQQAIERWLAAIRSAAASDWPSAYEIALAGRLVKGYGETNARGKRNLAHILDHVATGGTFAAAADRARALHDAREAALADEGGRGLDAALARHGAPPRPPVAQPIVWAKRSPASPPRRAA